MTLGNKKNPLEKTFFSREFMLSLSFYPDGGIKGLVHTFIRASPLLTTEVTGFYLDVESPKLVGFVEAGPSDFPYCVQSFFTGRIIKYNISNECLILKWAEFCAPLSSLKCSVRDNVIVLFDSHKKDYDLEIQQNKIVNGSLKMFKEELLY